MVENIAYCITGTSVGSVNAGQPLVQWLINAFSSQNSNHFWTVQNSNSTQILLKCIANNAQVVVHSSGNQISFGLAPDGGVLNFMANPPTIDSGKAWTGMRNITNQTSLMTLSGTDVRLAEYEDAFAFFVGPTIHCRYIMHIGRIYERVDSKDTTFELGGWGIINGRPLNSVFTGYWLTANNSEAYINHSMCVRSGNEVFAGSTGSVGFTLSRVITPYGANNTHLSNIDGKTRLVPHMCCICTTSSGVGPYIGSTRYLRQYKSNFEHWQVLNSTTAGSDQAWLGWVADTGSTPNNNQCLLWSKTPTAI